MPKKKTLIEQNKPTLYSFIILNIVIGYIFLFISDPSIDKANEFLAKITIKQGVFTLVIPFIVLILTSLLSSNTKYKLIFFRFNNPLPGSRAFSKLMFKDPRIDVVNLEKKYSPFPEKASEQNSLWYKIYQKHRNNNIVIASHRKFLLLRELATISFLLWLAVIIVLFIFKSEFSNSNDYIIFLLVQFILLNVGARNLGVRFTCNVLTEESIN